MILRPAVRPALVALLALAAATAPARASLMPEVVAALGGTGAVEGKPNGGGASVALSLPLEFRNHHLPGVKAGIEVDKVAPGGLQKSCACEQNDRQCGLACDQEMFGPQAAGYRRARTVYGSNRIPQPKLERWYDNAKGGR